MAETPQTANPKSKEPVAHQVGLGAQYIKDFSFESPNAPNVFAALQNPKEVPQLNIDVNVLSHGLGEGAFEATLQLKLESKIAGKTAFIAELAYAGVFVLPQMPEEQLKLFLLVEAPRLLFPFARAIISNAVREGGFPNLVLQPIDFLSLYAQQRGVGPMTPAGAA